MTFVHVSGTKWLTLGHIDVITVFGVAWDKRWGASLR